MSKQHHHHHQECCPQMMGQSMPGFGAGGYGGFAGAGFSGGGSQGAGSGIRWIYALLILIVIVLQFSKREHRGSGYVNMGGSCDCEIAAAKDEIAVSAVGGCGGLKGLFNGNNELIDNSVLFIIVVFLLILCTGCWQGGSGNYGDSKAGYGAFGGCGSF